jgi:hypothetical protein
MEHEGHDHDRSRTSASLYRQLFVQQGRKGYVRRTDMVPDEFVTRTWPSSATTPAASGKPCKVATWRRFAGGVRHE